MQFLKCLSVLFILTGCFSSVQTRRCILQINDHVRINGKTYYSGRAGCHDYVLAKDFFGIDGETVVSSELYELDGAQCVPRSHIEETISKAKSAWRYCNDRDCWK